ncbi:cobalamin biosynthesis protein CbiL [Rhodobacter maris]|uniref:Nickel transport protein n=1 Tax=Rhodobacter maris TaxID=446682 RepID=A0A285SRE0_9RHOB|nr:cobalamin biosynthesis protein CbiL [Rhodobacter maris]SOC10840.1 nickel transport protein [Rhodobacter maris]
MIRPFALLLFLCAAMPANAHGMKVFARVIGDQVSGYGFFIGGGRPEGVDWMAEMAGAPVASGKTDTGGGFAFPVPGPITGPVTVTINTGDGHIAHTALSPERFGAAPGAPALPEPASPRVPGAPPLDQIVATAVAREVAPLTERIEQMDDRMRLTDLMSGIFLIIGLAGIGLWVRGLRR